MYTWVASGWKPAGRLPPQLVSSPTLPPWLGLTSGVRLVTHLFPHPHPHPAHPYCCPYSNSKYKVPTTVDSVLSTLRVLTHSLLTAPQFGQCCCCPILHEYTETQAIKSFASNSLTWLEGGKSEVQTQSGSRGRAHSHAPCPLLQASAPAAQAADETSGPGGAKMKGAHESMLITCLRIHQGPFSSFFSS